MMIQTFDNFNCIEFLENNYFVVIVKHFSKAFFITKITTVPKNGPKTGPKFLKKMPKIGQYHFPTWRRSHIRTNN